MNKSKPKALKILLTILLLPLIVLFFLGLVLYIPFDYIKYRRSVYYKNTKEKYRLFGGTSPYFKLYNIIKENDLPIDFYRKTYEESNAFGYFLYKNALILNDYAPEYNESSKRWLSEQEDGYRDFDSLIAEEEIKNCNKFLGKNVCNYAYFIIPGKDIPESAPLEFEKHRFVKTENNDILTALYYIIHMETN